MRSSANANANGKIISIYPYPPVRHNDKLEALRRERKRRERLRRQRLDTLKSLAIVLAMVVAVIVFTILIDSATNNNALARTLKYDKYESAVSGVEILSPVNVRSEPKLLTDGFGGNTFGMVSGRNISIPISKVFQTKTLVDPENGRFYGFSVEEILSIPDGKQYFPEKIVDDLDGIVWIHHSYVRINWPLPG